MSELEQRLHAVLKLARIDGQTVRLCPFCERCGIVITGERYFCEGCRAYGTYATLAIFVLEEAR